MIRPSFKHICHSFKALLCLTIAFTMFTSAQRRNRSLNPTGFDDVVFAVAFSPDGSTLAIARGAAEPSQRFGRIELWDTQSGKLRHVIKGFDGPVKSVSFLPDGQTLVSSSLEFRSSKIQQKARSRDGKISGELKWWDGGSGELKQKLTMPGEDIENLKLALSPDGQDLVVAESFRTYSFVSPNLFPTGPIGNSGPGFPSAFPRFPQLLYRADMKLVDARTGEVKHKLNGDLSRNVVYSPNGSSLAGISGGDVKLWNAVTGKEIRKLKGFKGRPNALAFSPNGEVLAVSSTDFEREDAGDFIKIIGISQVRLFDARTWTELRRITDIGAVNSIAFSADGKFLLMGGVMSQGDRDVAGIKILNLDSRVFANVPTGESFTDAVDFLAVSNNGSFVAFRTGPTTVTWFDVKTWTVKQTVDANSAGDAIERPASRFLLSVKRVLAVAFSGDEKTVAAETDQGEIKVWDPRTGEVRASVVDEKRVDPDVVAVSDDGRFFAEVAAGVLRVWNSVEKTKKTIDAPAKGSSELAVSPDGELFAFASGREITIVDATGKVVRRFAGPHSAVALLNFSADGELLAAADDAGTIEVWGVKTQQIKKTISTGSPVSALRFRFDSRVLATASNQDIALWNLDSGEQQARFQKHDDIVNALAFSPDGQLLASGGDDRTVILWDLQSGKARRTLKGHEQTVTSLAFSPGGLLLASGGGNASVIVWDVKTGKFTRVLQ
jgi:WD40 repeat protein